MRHHNGRLGHATQVIVVILAATALGANDPPRNDPDRREIMLPGLTRSGAVLLPNGWTLQPAGKQSPLGDLPVLLVENPQAPILAILHAGFGEHEVWTLDAKTGRTIARTAIPASFSGLTWSADGARLYVGGGFDDVIYGFDHKDGLLSNQSTYRYPDRGELQKTSETGQGDKKRQRVIAGLAVSADGKSLWAANAFGHTLARFDIETRTLVSEVELGLDSYPYGLALDENAGRIYVSLWGAAKVAVVDIKANVLQRHYETQEHPNEMITAKKGQYLFVANANRNTVTVLDTKKGQAVETINTAIAPNAPAGSTPSSLALTPDESILLVANANTNDLAAFNVKEPGKSTPLGFIPVGWYPTSVRVGRDGKTLWVTNGKGGSSRANRDGPRPGFAGGGENRTRQYIGGLLLGTLSTIPMPSPRQMAEYSRTVYACSPIKKDDPGGVTGPEASQDSPVPRKVGEPSPITHCVYIIKENRTYDQVFGDMPEGNGEPSLCLFPEQVTPNHHALAREFVLLDNFYVESEVSADGHEWTMGAYATDFVERTWPLGYRGDSRVPFPAEGNFAIATPAGGYLWDRAAAKGVSYRSYGEFIENGKTPADPSHTKVKALQGHFDPKYRGYDLAYSDQKRADRFLEELAGFEKAGEMPRLIVLRLPNDHTSGTAPGKPTVSAMVADNDLALGRVVEGLSRSKFWPKLAIFVVEDDAQNGSDHVDAHRTVALVISPYVKRKAVDSTMYSTSSMLRTIELILGLDPMSQFDASSRPMSPAFIGEPNPSPYSVRPANVDLNELNLRTAPGAEASMKLDLSKEDQADDLVFNEIIWKAVKGANSTMPPPVRAAFVVPRVEDDDDDDD
ncbi:bifunctional YncE family protein/alkaline phosphatase family protein [Singulisphaera acidiphila]|uniref:Phosphoesterase family protein n=1 Tax=Singulisphaera acidiphila (strain ATCC BAA-1392 / DSM 18658 / VKM B-2454 / MOB10) TaxID=886293 RepID=L0DD08_SINAD|nr:bifunctional YncE family protein/alkaline phosphatase family protein [Singulisphaera acidiphila]AGA26750.1 Phosphoesterase family protein [Singulisphaera acidiphila DSM 18658]